MYYKQYIKSKIKSEEKPYIIYDPLPTSSYKYK